MQWFFDEFEGIGPSSDPEDLVELHDPEDLDLADLDKHIRLLRARIEIQEQQRKGMHRRAIANFILFGSLIFLASLFVIGVFRDDFEPAKLWWTFVGPLVGYLLRVLFEDKGRAP